MSNVADKLWQKASYNMPADLKEEFDKLIDGHGAFEGIGQVLLLRSLSLDFCACWDAIQGSSSDCKFCLGESYTWEESYHKAYFTQSFGRGITGVRQEQILEPPGYMDEGKSIVYMKAFAAPKDGDKIFRLGLNDSGSIYYPNIERIEKWKITGVEDKRYDRSRLAYYICLCEREEA
jgi:hypothetical protein